MFFKRIFTNLLLIFLIIILFCPATAMTTRVYKFKGVAIPFDLKYKDSIFKKGKYDFEILFHHKQQVFYLKILKKGKGLCLIPGEKLKYKSYGWERLRDPKIPDQPTLRIKKYPTGKIVNIIFESGKKTAIYPLVKVRFKLEYEL